MEIAGAQATEDEHLREETARAVRRPWHSYRPGRLCASSFIFTTILSILRLAR